MTTETPSAIRRNHELTVPDDAIWERYSANGESVFSGVASFTIHVVALTVILIGLVSFFDRTTDTAIPIDVITVGGDGPEGGGRGQPEANNVIPGTLPKGIDDPQPIEPQRAQPQDATEWDPIVKQNRGTDFVNPFKDLEKRFAGRPAVPKLGDSAREVNPRLLGPGVKGPGEGGAGEGDGDGVGNKKGSDVGKTKRDKRRDRWELVFATMHARNYLQQLDALGAVIAVPDTRGRLMTIRDLRERPAQPRYEDVRAMNRIFWLDDRPESVDSVADELQLHVRPSAIIAFFPYSFEEDLLRKELAFAGRAEEDIDLTRFAISFSGGKAVIRVIEQRPKATKGAGRGR